MIIKDDGLCPDRRTRSLILVVDEFGWNSTVYENCSWCSISDTKKEEAYERILAFVSPDGKLTRAHISISSPHTEDPL